VSPFIQRADPSGLALSDWLLLSGFLHCPLAFFGGRNLDQIYRISLSDEMKPWSIGGKYDRPICRRIVEQEGIPREMFGRDKKAASVVLWDHNEGFLPPLAMSQYQAWLNRHNVQWLASRRLPPTWAAKLHSLRSTAARMVRGRDNGTHIADDLFGHMFPWALESAVRRYTQTAAVTR
jgi:hypothetical protein